MTYTQDQLRACVIKTLQLINKETGCTFDERSAAGNTMCVYIIKLPSGLKRGDGQPTAAMVSVDATKDIALTLMMGSGQPINKKADQVMDFCAEMEKNILVTVERARQRATPSSSSLAA